MDAEDLIDRLPSVRGRLQPGQPLGPITWFRVGGPAEVMFAPADTQDLAAFLSAVSPDIAVTVIGVGSNLLVRDGGVRGVVVRLGRGFAGLDVLEGDRIRVGTAVPDKRLADFALRNRLAGFSFYHGIPGSIGGALRMNAGANGFETRDRLIEVEAVDRAGSIHNLSLDDMAMTYRHSGAAADLIFTSAVYQGTPADEAEIRVAMDAVQEHREAAQPIRERTGGSTFKNPEDGKAWELIDAAGCRGLRIGGAHVSEKHCNFLINSGSATAYDLELLGETVRARVKRNSGIDLEWEIKRIGEGAPIEPELKP